MCCMLKVYVTTVPPFLHCLSIYTFWMKGGDDPSGQLLLSSSPLTHSLHTFECNRYFDSCGCDIFAIAWEPTFPFVHLNNWIKPSVWWCQLNQFSFRWERTMLSRWMMTQFTPCCYPLETWWWKLWALSSFTRTVLRHKPIQMESDEDVVIPGAGVISVIFSHVFWCKVSTFKKTQVVTYVYDL